MLSGHFLQVFTGMVKEFIHNGVGSLTVQGETALRAPNCGQESNYLLFNPGIT